MSSDLTIKSKDQPDCLLKYLQLQITRFKLNHWSKGDRDKFGILNMEISYCLFQHWRAWQRETKQSQIFSKFLYKKFYSWKNANYLYNMKLNCIYSDTSGKQWPRGKVVQPQIWGARFEPAVILWRMPCQCSIQTC